VNHVDGEGGAFGQRAEALVDDALLTQLREAQRGVDGAGLDQHQALRVQAVGQVQGDAVRGDIPVRALGRPLALQVEGQPQGRLALVQHALNVGAAARELQRRVQPVHQVGRLRHGEHRHVVRAQVADAPVRLCVAHRVAEGAAAADQDHPAAAALGQQVQPLLQDRIRVEAADELDDPHGLSRP